MLEFWRLLITCDYADCQVPPGCESLFVGAEEELDSPEGYDPGALLLARNLGAAFGVKPVYNEITRLLADVNRGPRDANRFSAFTGLLPRDDLRYLDHALHTPYWERVENVIRAAVEQGMPVVHLGIHTFDGPDKDEEVFVRCNPNRDLEHALATAIVTQLETTEPALPARLLTPRKGKHPVLIAAMRKRFNPIDYIGLEVSLNQRLAAAEGAPRRRAHAALRTAIGKACEAVLPTS